MQTKQCKNYQPKCQKWTETAILVFSSNLLLHSSPVLTCIYALKALPVTSIVRPITA
jgi:hypothetical protein